MHFNESWENAHLEKANQNIKKLYYKLKDKILDIADDLKVYTTRVKHVSFQVGGRRFAAFEIYENYIYIYLKITERELRSRNPVVRKYPTHCSISIKDEENLADALDCIKQSYETNKSALAARRRKRK